jgi:hypothetical protein
VPKYSVLKVNGASADPAWSSHLSRRVGWSGTRRVTWLAQLPESAAQGFDLLFIGSLLPLRYLQCFQDLVHFIERVPERLDDPSDFFNGVLNGSG